MTTDDVLQARMRAGVWFWGISTTFVRVLKAFTALFLVWWLTPDDFGLVAITGAIIVFLQVIAEFGIPTAVIQKKDMSGAYPDVAFTLHMGLSLATVALAWAVAPAVAAFYGRGEVVWLLRVGALGMPVLALRNLPMALMRRRLEFGRFAAVDTVWQIGASVLSVGFALAGAGYWSLVVPPILMGVLVTPAWWRYAHWRPGFALDQVEMRDIAGFARGIVLVMLLGIVMNNIGFVYAGRLLPTEEAGIYKFAYEYAMFIVVNFAWTVANVSLSGFAAQQDAPEKLRVSFGRMYDMLLALTLPLHVLLFVHSDLLFASIFPVKWAPALPIFRVLLVLAVVRAIMSHATQFYYAVRRARVNVVFVAVQTALAVPIFYVACRYYGLRGLAWSTAVLYGISAVALLAVAPGLNGWPPLGYLRRTAPVALACAAMAAGTLPLDLLLRRAEVPPLAVFALVSVVGGLAYLFVLGYGAPARFRQLCDDLLPPRLSGKIVRIFSGR